MWGYRGMMRLNPRHYWQLQASSGKRHPALRISLLDLLLDLLMRAWGSLLRSRKLSGGFPLANKIRGRKPEV